jgi:hypothetical protein
MIPDRYPTSTHWVSQEKNKRQHQSILENGVNVLFSEMPLNILHSVSYLQMH